MWNYTQKTHANKFKNFEEKFPVRCRGEMSFNFSFSYECHFEFLFFSCKYFSRSCGVYCFILSIEVTRKQTYKKENKLVTVCSMN